MADTSIPLSRVFSSISHLKQAHTIVEDYTVADTTLEQVFLFFAKLAESETENVEEQPKSKSNHKQPELKSNQKQTESESSQKQTQSETIKKESKHTI